MQIEEWPVVGTSEFIAAYRLDEVDLSSIVGSVGAGQRDAPGDAVALWAAARQVPGAVSMVLRSAERVWAAAGAVLVEGKPGLNVGLLMPSLRTVPAVPAGAGGVAAKPVGDLRRTLWALAERIERVEADRIFLLEAGKTHRLHVGRDGFSIAGGTSVAAMLADVQARVEGGGKVRYSLGPEETAAGPVLYSVASLFGADPAARALRLSDDGWPMQVPETARLGVIGLAMTLVQRLTAMGSGSEAKLSVFGAGSSLLATVAREPEAWTASVPPSIV
jgi:hypothetical protein